MSIRKQIKESIFNIFEEFIEKFTEQNLNDKIIIATNKQLNNYESSSSNNNIITILPNIEEIKKQNQIKNFDNNLSLTTFDVHLNQTLPKLKCFQKAKKAFKKSKPSFLKNNKKSKNYLTNSNILYFNNNEIVISKKFMKKATNYDLIVLDKSKLNLKDLNLNLKN